MCLLSNFSLDMIVKMMLFCGYCIKQYMSKDHFQYSTDISNKLFIADFGANRKLDLAQPTLLSQMAGSFSWSSYEDVGGIQYKYKKESDIQVSS